MRITPSVCCRWAMLAGAALLAQPVPASAPGTAEPEQVKVGHDLSQRMTVPVTIGSSGPYQFVVDTGAERTLISRELADRLTLTPSHPVTILSVAGEDLVQTAQVSRLRLTSSRDHMEDFDAPLIAETHLGAVGMLGIDSLQRKKVVVDFRTMRMSISDASTSYRTDSDEIVVTARRRSGQLILVDAEAEGQKVSVIIDTGAEVSIGNPMLRERLAARKRLSPPVPILITSVTGEVTPAAYTSMRLIRIGGATLSNMPVAFADVQIFHRLGLDKKPALLLGMDALKLFDRVSIDFANRNVRFLMPGDALGAPPPMLVSLTPHQG